MHKLRTILLAAAATAGLATTAVAFPLNDISVQAQGVSPVQNARVYCGGGRCVLTRRHARHWYRSHGYAYGPRAYGAYGYAPRAYSYYGWR
jgi:hypothetical protein